MVKRIIFLFVLSTAFIYSQNNKLNFTVDEVNQLLDKALTSIQPSDTTALMLRVRQEALAKMNYADTSYLFDRAKTFIKDSLNIVRADLDVVRNEVSRQLDSTQIKLLISDSLNLNARNWQTLQNVADRIKDSLNANARNWQNKIQVSAIIGDSLNANSKDWQSRSSVLTTLTDSLNLLRAELDAKINTLEELLNRPGVLPDSLTLSSTDINFNTITKVSKLPNIFLDFEEGNISEFTSITKLGDNNTITVNSLNPLSGNYDLKVTAVDNSTIYGVYDFIPFADSLIWIKFKMKLPPKFTGAVPGQTFHLFSLQNSDSNKVIAELALKVGNDTTISNTIFYTNLFPAYSLSSPDGILLENTPQTVIIKANTTYNNGSILVYIDNNLVFELNQTPVSSYNANRFKIGLLTFNISLNNVSLYYDDIIVSNDSTGLNYPSSYSNWNDGFLYTTLNIKNDSLDIIGIENIHGLEAPFYSDTLDHIYLNTGEQRQINIYADPYEDNNTYTDTLFISTSEQITQKVVMNYIINDWYVDPYATGLNDGTSWENAWTSLNNINWSIIDDRDTIFISGGTDSIVYNTTNITIKKSNVTITKGRTPGHNGRVIFKSPNTPGTDYALYIVEKKNITIDGLEFVDYRLGVLLRSRLPLGVENIFVKNCKMYFTVDTVDTPLADVKLLATDYGGTSDTTWFNRFNNIHIVNNEFISPKWCTLPIHAVNTMNSWNVYVVGNKFINRNNNPAVTDFFFYSNATHSYVLRNFFYYHSAKARSGGNAQSYGIYGGEKAGYHVIAFNIFANTDSLVYPNIYTGYFPISNPNGFRRNWDRMIVVNNTFFGTQRRMTYGSDLDAYIANNIFYRSTTSLYGGVGYIQGNEIGNPVLDSIRYNAFVDFGQGTDIPTWVRGYSNTLLPASNYAIRSNNPADWYSPFTSGILTLSEPDSLINDSYFIPDTTKPYYINGENVQTIIPQKVIDSNMKEPGLSWFEYYWNNAADYFGNPYKNKIGAVQQ